MFIHFKVKSDAHFHSFFTNFYGFIHCAFQQLVKSDAKVYQCSSFKTDFTVNECYM